VWQQVLKMLQIDLRDVPPPTAADVPSNLKALINGTTNFAPVAPAAVRDVGPLRREISNALELGYKAGWGSRVGVGVDLYVTRVYDRVAPSRTALTPNVFYDRASLEQYLAQYRSPTEAAALAAKIAGVNVGTVSPIQSPYPIDLLFVSRQGQKYTLWGVDVAAELALDARFSLSGSVSWISYDSLAGALPGAPVVLSIPGTKGSLRLAYRNDAAGFAAAVQARAISSFPLGAGTGGPYRESRIAGYGLVDLNVSHQVGATRHVNLSADVQNAFDNRHREIAGAPALGRLGLLLVRMEF
jgi:TonB dependent receptor